MSDIITRFSSRKERLHRVFLKDRLSKAATYDRIAGYFRSSIFNIILEEIKSIDRVRIVCNADMDPRDLTNLKIIKEVRDQAQLARWHGQRDARNAISEIGKWTDLCDMLKSEKVQIKVVSRNNAAFLHGKAGVIRCRDRTTSSFVGSINETASGWEESYEMIWEDRSPEAAKWVQSEFDWLWKIGVDLSDAVIDEIDRTARRVEVQIDKLKTDPLGLAKSVVVESPLAINGEKLAIWQKKFVEEFIRHDRAYGAARLLLADEVGVGKTLSMAATGALSVLLGHGPFLILCPANLTLQWQMEIWDKLGLPSCVWSKTTPKGWRDHNGHLYRKRDVDDVLQCPTQIGIVSTGLLTHGGDEANKLMKGKYGMIALDEGHRARVNRTGSTGRQEPVKLYRAMMSLASRTRHLVIGTATPIQTRREEIWDLMEILAKDKNHVLGRETTSRWWNADEALKLITGETKMTELDDAWEWLRNPLPLRDESSLFASIRDDLGVPDEMSFTDEGISQLEADTRVELEQALKSREAKKNIDFMCDHNPLGRHVILRRRKMLEDAGKLPRIAVNIHPKEGCAPSVFERGMVSTPPFYNDAYEEVRKFTRKMADRKKGTGFLVTLMMHRICSSIAAGRATAEKMLDSRRCWTAADDTDPNEQIEALGAGDTELTEQIEAMGVNEYAAAIGREASHLEEVIRILGTAGIEDPKGRAVKHYLKEEDWLDQGCIIFSQYYDTALWVGEQVSGFFPKEPVAVYAGASKSGVLLKGEWQSMSRENIKEAVRERKVRLVCATDAACEGLNLQTLGTLINMDLPWNPSRLEQRLGRIKRYGQHRREVDMANLVYMGTHDEKVYRVLSERMHDKYDILGSLPDTIEDDWIENEERLEKAVKDFTKPPSPANVFTLRHGNILETKPGEEGEEEWEVWHRVVSKQDILERMTKPWNGRKGKSDKSGS